MTRGWEFDKTAAVNDLSTGSMRVRGNRSCGGAAQPPYDLLLCHASAIETRGALAAQTPYDLLLCHASAIETRGALAVQ
jgi:hypothetical protein